MGPELRRLRLALGTVLQTIKVHSGDICRVVDKDSVRLLVVEVKLVELGV